MRVFQKFFCIFYFSVISTSVPNFIEVQNTWCNPFAHLAWNDPRAYVVQWLENMFRTLLGSYWFNINTTVVWYQKSKKTWDKIFQI